MDAMADRRFGADPGRLSLEPFVGRITDEEVSAVSGLSVRQVVAARHHGVGLFEADWWASRFGRTGYDVWESEWERAETDDPIVASRPVLRAGTGTRVLEGDLLFVRKSGAFDATPLYETPANSLTIDPSGERLSESEEVEVGLAGPGAERWEPVPLGDDARMVIVGETEAGHHLAYWPQKERLVTFCPSPEGETQPFPCECAKDWQLHMAEGPDGRRLALVIAPDNTVSLWDRDDGAFVLQGQLDLDLEG